MQQFVINIGGTRKMGSLNGLYFILFLLAYSNAADVTKQCPVDEQQNPDLFTEIVQVPNHDCKCSSKEKGTLRYRDEKLEMCNGNEFASVVPDPKKQPPKLGTTSNNPADSCRQILEADNMVMSGVYWIKAGSATIQTYCVMETICGSPGWSMVIKMDGSKKTFQYDSEYWTNKNELNASAVREGLDGNAEFKLLTYSSTPFTKLCLGFERSRKWLLIKMTKEMPSLYSIISPGTFQPTNVGVDGWKALVYDASLQRNCHKEGFNNIGLYPTAAKARIGIVGNNENDCKSPDSRIGLGTQGTSCGAKDDSAGNEARCGGDNGNKSITGMAFILVQ